MPNAKRIASLSLLSALAAGGLYAARPSSAGAPQPGVSQKRLTASRSEVEKLRSGGQPLPSGPSDAPQPEPPRDRDERARVERDKAAFASRPATHPPELSDAVKADPDLYEAGPGPHLQRYGGRSGAMPADMQPEDAEVTTVLQSEGPFPRLAVWVPSYRVSSGADVSLQARLVGEQGEGLMADTVSATIVDKQTGEAHQRTLSATSAGSYQLVFKPPPPSAGASQYEYVVYAVTQNADGSEALRTAQGAFQVHSLVARVLEAEAQAVLHGGNLELELPVQIETAGDYTFYAELWGGRDGEVSVAFGLDTGESLVRGRHVAKVTFGGSIIRDRGADGPFVIRNVRVRRVTDFPFVEAEPVARLLKTPAWPAETFR